MWNTGCRGVHNQTGAQLIWVDWETVGAQVAQIGRIPADTNISLYGLIFPWCINSQEVIRKAFRFYIDLWPDEEIPPWRFGNPEHFLWIHDHLAPLAPLFHSFQNYNDNQVYYVVPNGVNDVSWSNIKYCGEGPSSNVDLYIASDPTSVWARAV